MFNIDQFVADCKGKRASAVKELLEEALSDPESIKQALAGIDAEIGQSNIGDMALAVPRLRGVGDIAPGSRRTRSPHVHTAQRRNIC